MAGTVTLLHLLASFYPVCCIKILLNTPVSGWTVLIYRALLLSVENINCISNFIKHINEILEAYLTICHIYILSVNQN